MKTSPLHTASLALLLAAGSACASSKGAEVKDEQLGSLPREDRQALIDEQRSIDVAKANVDAAKVAANQAREFKDLVDNEVTAAKADRDAADNSPAYSGAKQAQADRDAKREIAAQQVAAAETKGEYANKLIELRDAEIEAREADLLVAQAAVDRAKYETLRQRGLGGDVDRQAILDHQRDAEEKRAAAQQKVAQLRNYADVSKGHWDKAQERYQASAKATQADDRPVQPPAGAKYLPQPAVKERPADATPNRP